MVVSTITQWALWLLLRAIAGISKEHWWLLVNKVQELEFRAIDSALKQKEAAAYVKGLLGDVNAYIVNLLVELAVWANRASA